ncbi:MAG: hypothetical protein EOO22_01485 [Comamonadaceae bacterium]|nr:MAG: hypothetical protein EOO22_01485 [Comamonadaceae bacterium]
MHNLQVAFAPSRHQLIGPAAPDDRVEQADPIRHVDANILLHIVNSDAGGLQTAGVLAHLDKRRYRDMRPFLKFMRELRELPAPTRWFLDVGTRISSTIQFLIANDCNQRLFLQQGSFLRRHEVERLCSLPVPQHSELSRSPEATIDRLLAGIESLCVQADQLPDEDLASGLSRALRKLIGDIRTAQQPNVFEALRSRLNSVAIENNSAAARSLRTTGVQRLQLPSDELSSDVVEREPLDVIAWPGGEEARKKLRENSTD